MNTLQNSSNKKREFIITSLELFAEKGYDKTTIQDIIDQMGVSKGAFYHYFSSKEDIIITIAREYVSGAIHIIKGIAEKRDLNAVEKVNTLMESVNQYKAQQEEHRLKIKGIFSKEKNIKLERKIESAFKGDALKYLKEIIDQGIEEGSFDTINSKELAEFMLFAINAMNASIDELVNKKDNPESGMSYQEIIDQLVQKLTFYEEVFARFLNAKEGSIKLQEAYLKRFGNGER